MSPSDDAGFLTPSAPGGVAAIRGMIVCLDRSPCSEASLPCAFELAKCSRAKVFLVHVLESYAPLHEHLPTDTLEWAMARAEAEDYLADVAREWACDELEIETAILQGHPAEQVLCFSDRHDVDLIVVTSHGEKGVSEWGLSSTADKIVNRARTSVLVVPPWAHPWEKGESFLKRILVLLDGSPRAETVLPPLQRLARSIHSTLIFLHVVTALELTPFTPYSDEDLELHQQVENRNERVARRYMERVLANYTDPDYEVRGRVEQGDARLVPAQVAELEKVGLIAFTAHGMTGSRSWCYGGTAGYLIHNTRIPTLMIQNLPSRPSDFAGAVRHQREEAPLRGRSRAASS